MLTHLSLFSGIGGLDLAAEWAGFRTAGQCEWADYPTKILERHWPDVPRWRDILTLTKESFYERTGLRTVELISGGFPCQPFSVAGKRRGKDDDRYLWPEMLRVINELRPAWVVGENVAGIVNMALDQVLSDLENQGYQTRAFIIPACGVDAPHRRDRCAIVAWNDDGQPNRGKSFSALTRAAEGPNPEPSRIRDDVADAHGGEALRRGGGPSKVQGPGDIRPDYGGGTPEYGFEEWWPAEPDVGRVAHGIPSRVDRLKCLGNAVVPAQFYPIFQAIADIENQRKGEADG